MGEKRVGPFLVDDSIDVTSGPAIRSYRHQWERVGIFSRCSVCGWGWKIGYDNDFPCPGGPLIEHIAELMEASPRMDWLTSGQREIAAEKVYRGLLAKGWKITSDPELTCQRPPGHAGLCLTRDAGGKLLWWEDPMHGRRGVT